MTIRTAGAALQRAAVRKAAPITGTAAAEGKGIAAAVPSARGRAAVPLKAVPPSARSISAAPKTATTKEAEMIATVSPRAVRIPSCPMFSIKAKLKITAVMTATLSRTAISRIISLPKRKITPKQSSCLKRLRLKILPNAWAAKWVK